MYILYFFLDIDDACVVNADCEELGESVECINLKCQIVNEIKGNNTKTHIKSANKINNNNGDDINNSRNSNNNRIRNNNNNIITNKILTKRQTSTTTSSETTSNLSKSSPSDSILDNQSKLLNGDIDFRSISSETDSEGINTDPEHDDNVNEPEEEEQDERVVHVETPQHHRYSEPIPAKKSREIAVQTSIEAFELKLLAPKTKNVGTVTTASTSSSSRRPSKQRRRPAQFRFDDDEKTFSTLSNTDDDIENRNCKYILQMFKFKYLKSNFCSLHF